MGKNFIEYKVRAKTTWTGGQTFEVVRLVYKPSKPPILVRERVLFTGNILQCKAYLDLKLSDNIIQ
jgi:hypothetical protein